MNKEELEKLIEGCKVCIDIGSICKECPIKKECHGMEIGILIYPYLKRLHELEYGKIDTTKCNICGDSGLVVEEDINRDSPLRDCPNCKNEIETTKELILAYITELNQRYLKAIDKDILKKEHIEGVISGFLPFARYELTYSMLKIDMKEDVTDRELTTGQVIDFLAKNIKSKFKNLSNNNRIYTHDTLVNYLMSTSLLEWMTTKWKLIPPAVEVSFAEAFKAYKRGKTIKPWKNRDEEFSLNGLTQIGYVTDEEIDNMWIILD